MFFGETVDFFLQTIFIYRSAKSLMKKSKEDKQTLAELPPFSLILDFGKQNTR